MVGPVEGEHEEPAGDVEVPDAGGGGPEGQERADGGYSVGELRDYGDDEREYRVARAAEEGLPDGREAVKDERGRYDADAAPGLEERRFVGREYAEYRAGEEEEREPEYERDSRAHDEAVFSPCFARSSFPAPMF